MWADRGIDPLAVTLRTEMPRCRHVGSVATQLLNGRFVDQVQVRAPPFTSKGPLVARATVRETARPALTPRVTTYSKQPKISTTLPYAYVVPAETSVLARFLGVCPSIPLRPADCA